MSACRSRYTAPRSTRGTAGQTCTWSFNSLGSPLLSSDSCPASSTATTARPATAVCERLGCASSTGREVVDLQQQRLAQVQLRDQHVARARDHLGAAEALILAEPGFADVAGVDRAALDALVVDRSFASARCRRTRPSCASPTTVASRTFWARASSRGCGRRPSSNMIVMNTTSSMPSWSWPAPGRATHARRPRPASTEDRHVVRREVPHRVDVRAHCRDSSAASYT